MKKINVGSFIPLPVVPIVLIGTNVQGKPNYLPVGFVSGVNANPPIICISLNNSHYTPKGILENHTFSLNIPSVPYVKETDYCGIVSGRDTDKSNIFTSFYGELKTAPMIEEFPIVCECRYIGQKIEFAMDTIYFGEVVQVYMNEEILGSKERIDIVKANPIYYCGIDNKYRELGNEIGSGWEIGKQYK